MVIQVQKRKNDQLCKGNEAVISELSSPACPVILLKVTVDLQGCLPKNHSHARVLCYNHKKVYIIVKVIKCRIIGNNFFLDLI